MSQPHGFRERLGRLLSHLTPERVVGVGGLALLCAASALALAPEPGLPLAAVLERWIGAVSQNVLAGLLQQLYQTLATQPGTDEQERLTQLARALKDKIERDASLRVEIGTFLDELDAVAIAEEVLRGNPAVHGWLLVQIRSDARRHWAEFAKIQEALARIEAKLETRLSRVPINLETAQAQLEAMPLDKIPTAGPFLLGSPRCPSQNQHFVGRQADLIALAKALKGGETTAIGQIAVATGLGGIGKTQLAVEFVHRYGQYFAGGVFWLSFGDPAAIPAEVAACGQWGSLDLPDGFDTFPLDDQVRLVLMAWRSSLPRLLVFDSCEDQALLARWRPPTGGCRVLVTTRRAAWDATLGVHMLPLGGLSRAESIALLRKSRLDLADGEADVIAEELGDLPLALHLAGSYLARYRHAVTPVAYLTQLRQPNPLAHRSLQVGGISPTQHAQNVAQTFALSYQRLNPAELIDVLAWALLGRAAYFAPGEPIPRNLLRATLTRDLELETEQAEDGLARLVELGLIEEAEGALVLHRLVAAFVRGVAADDEAQGAVEEVLFAEANRLNQAGYPAPLLDWQVHLRAVTDAAQEREDERSALLCSSLGYHLDMIGDYSGARPYLERALRIYEKVLGGEHPATALSLNNLGLLLHNLGDLVGARPYCERALRIYEKVLGEEHPETALSLNNLGVLLQAQGDLAGARPYLERALSIYEKVLSGEHPETARSLNNLGLLLHNLGDLAGARPYYERALRIYEKVLEEDHPNTALSLNNLGALLQAQGDLAGARPYLERALRIYEKVLGGEHPATALSLNNLGLLLHDQGDLAGARSYYERALRIYEKVLGREHPDTARSLSNLGSLLYSMGDLTRARPYYGRALRIHEKVLGGEHPATATSLNNLGLLLQAQGDLAGARPYYERALRIQEKVLGAEHPDTALSLSNLGALLQALGDLAEARPYYERALRIREKVLGAEHPDTATSLNNLGMLLQAQGDLAGARPFYVVVFVKLLVTRRTSRTGPVGSFFLVAMSLAKATSSASVSLAPDPCLAAS
jgi:tetratricopeptide (TPR) repeat protein